MIFENSMRLCDIRLIIIKKNDGKNKIRALNIVQFSLLVEGFNKLKLYTMFYFRLKEENARLSKNNE